MAEGITWNELYLKNIFDDTIGLLSGLDRNGQQTLGNLSVYMPKGSNPSRKKDVLKILERIGFVEYKKMARSALYDITPIGRLYLDTSDENERNDIFHSYLYQSILHYSYAYDYILENDYYRFTKEDFIGKLALRSSIDFGTRIYDWKSGENTLNFMEALNVITKDEKGYLVTETYRRKFNERKFIEMIENSFKKDKLQYTKSLCEYLSVNSPKFMVTKEFVTIETIYKKLLKLNEMKEFLNFIPGLPRPPIPTKHSLVELKGGL